jgi:aspartyl-tRNA(Asn)/glutamyl-tRNA(Gln) amidotransferase subunit C
MSLTRTEVERIAALARLELAPDEVQAFTGQLAAILAYVEQLQAVDTTGVAPTAHLLQQDTALRDDEEHPSLPREAALANAPEASAADGLFTVPRVIG